MFLRSLVGLDRAAAKGAFREFIADKELAADQIEFIDMIVNALCENGIDDLEMFYESPFTDMAIRESLASSEWNEPSRSSASYSASMVQ